MSAETRKNCSEMYKEELADYKAPDYIKVDENGKVVYSPDMTE